MGNVALIIKGPKKSAARAAQRHGVTLASCRVVGSDRPDVQCYVSCRNSPRETNRQIVDWFTARSRTKAGRGHPPGTLLYHGELCSTKQLGRRKRR